MFSLLCSGMVEDLEVETTVLLVEVEGEVDMEEVVLEEEEEAIIIMAGEETATGGANLLMWVDFVPRYK